MGLTPVELSPTEKGRTYKVLFFNRKATQDGRRTFTADHKDSRRDIIRRRVSSRYSQWKENRAKRGVR
jgi:hypothetical protein